MSYDYKIIEVEEKEDEDLLSFISRWCAANKISYRTFQKMEYMRCIIIIGKVFKSRKTYKVSVTNRPAFNRIMGGE